MRRERERERREKREERREKREERLVNASPCRAHTG